MRTWRDVIADLGCAASPEAFDQRIRDLLLRDDVPAEDRIHAVLTALYNGSSNAFAAEILLGEFRAARYPEKRQLMNLFETFHQMRRTSYRINESIEALEAYALEVPEFAAGTREMIEGLREFSEMFEPVE